MKYFDKDFFKFTLGFLGIVSLSLLIIMAVSAYAAGDVSSIVFTTEPQSIKPDELSGPITIQTQDASGNSFQTPETIDLSFKSSSPTGEFLGGTGKSASKVTMSKNTANRTVYYRDTSEGSFTLTANARGRTSALEWSANQQITISGTETSAPIESSPPPPLKEEKTDDKPIEEIKQEDESKQTTDTLFASTSSPKKETLLPAEYTPKNQSSMKEPALKKEPPAVEKKRGKEQLANVNLAQETELSTSSKITTFDNVIYEEPKRGGWLTRLWRFIKDLFS